MEEQQEAQNTSDYTPRPRWQVWGARFLLVFFIVILVMYYINVMRGGL